MKWSIDQEITVESIITKITAKPMPIEVSMREDTPKNEHRAINRIRRMLFTSNAERNIRNNSFPTSAGLLPGEMIEGRHDESHGNESSRRENHNDRWPEEPGCDL